MITYVALLRAVNVGGTGKLPMAELRELATRCGFADVATYIQSGNLVFRSKAGEASVTKTLEQALAKHLGKRHPVLIRTGEELRATLREPPFAEAPPARVLVYFMAKALAPEALSALRGRVSEECVLRGRELFVHYPVGAGSSKLQLPNAWEATGRNMNTVRKLLEMAEATGQVG